ncbi:MAG: hypothetical protein DRJ01_15555 [Bacteroidetes bacterium]|nr:MAG: hypothetical protein DRJ01_15555 [Bacteroidota bacterium]
MKTKFILLGSIIFIAQLMLSCRDRQGACSYDSNGDGNSDLCVNIDNPNNNSICHDDYQGQVEHSTTCVDYGYTKDNGDGTYSKPSSSGNNTVSYCTDSYQGPGVGTQLNSYCESAYTYLCVGGYSASSDEVSVNCDYYDAMNDNNYPDCPYCK